MKKKFLKEYQKKFIITFKLSNQGTFNFSGIEEAKHTFFGAVPYVTDETREVYLK